MKLQELLTAYNCAEAFWVGNLKNRDIRVSIYKPPSLSVASSSVLRVLQGQEILSQSSQANSTHREEEEEEEEEGEKEVNPASYIPTSCHEIHPLLGV